MASIFKLSEAVSIGLHAMLLLAGQPDRSLDNRRMAGFLGVSAAHLAKVLQRLQHAGLLVSTRGPGGGFHLARSAAEISLLEIYETLEGPLETRRCLLNAPKCSAGGCFFGNLFTDIGEKVRDFLATTKLAETRERGLRMSTSRKKQKPAAGQRVADKPCIKQT